MKFNQLVFFFLNSLQLILVNNYYQILKNLYFSIKLNCIQKVQWVSSSNVKFKPNVLSMNSQKNIIFQ